MHTQTHTQTRGEDYNTLEGKIIEKEKEERKRERETERDRERQRKRKRKREREEERMHAQIIRQ